MTERRRPDLLMPVSEERATQMIEIEALRQIVDNLRRLNDRSEEQMKLLHAMDTRLIRIESNQLDRTVEKLRADVDELQAERHRRLGADGAVVLNADGGPDLAPPHEHFILAEGAAAMPQAELDEVMLREREIAAAMAKNHFAGMTRLKAMTAGRTAV